MSDKNPTKAQLRERREELARFNKDEYHWIAHDYNLEMEEKTQYQIRYTGRGICVDIFPSSKKYFNIVNKERGKYEELEQFIKELITK